MTKHERRVELLLCDISLELTELIFDAALREGHGRSAAWYKIQNYKADIEALRDEMCDELSAPRGIKKLLSFFKRKGKK